MKILIAVYLWLLIGDLLLALRKWEYDANDDPIYRSMAVLLWPGTIWWNLRDLVRDWRTDLYRRTKHH
jgi:hypothetical protein